MRVFLIVSSSLNLPMRSETFKQSSEFTLGGRSLMKLVKMGPFLRNSTRQKRNEHTVLGHRAGKITGDSEDL